MLTDEQLRTKATELDPTALRELHQQFYGHVARYIQFKVSNPRVAEDLTSEVFVRVLENLKQGTFWKTSVKGWIMGIAHHVVVDYYRKKERITEVQLNEQLTSSPTANPLHQAILSNRKQLLMDAINQLTEDQRDVIMMRFIQGMDIQSVAEAINKTSGAVKGLQYRAMRALAEKLQHIEAE